MYKLEHVQDPTAWMLSKPAASDELTSIEQAEQAARRELSEEQATRMARRFAAKFAQKHSTEHGGYFVNGLLRR